MQPQQQMTLSEQLDKTFKTFQKLSKSTDIADEDKIKAAGDALLYILEVIDLEEKKKNNKDAQLESNPVPNLS